MSVRHVRPLASTSPRARTFIPPASRTLPAFSPLLIDLSAERRERGVHDDGRWEGLGADVFHPPHLRLRPRCPRGYVPCARNGSRCVRRPRAIVERNAMERGSVALCPRCAHVVSWLGYVGLPFLSRERAGASPFLRALLVSTSSSTLSIICICIPVETGCIAINDTMACT